MGLYGSIDSRNHGYGRAMSHAGTQVLRERCGGGHFASVATHSDRWAAFSDFAKTEDIRDMRDITTEVVAAYAEAMREQGLAVSTMQNSISTINVVLGHAREGAWTAISPRAMVGASRTQVRTEAPATLDRERFSAAQSDLRAAGLERSAAVLGLARELGMRSREAVLADLSRLAKEATKYGAANVQDGTKGGRTAPRWVPVTPAAQAAIAAAIAARPGGSQNLLAPGESYKSWRAGELRAGRAILHEHGIKGYHDARAGYACERYTQITGHQAPAVAGQRAATKAADQAARTTIAQELGHGRRDVVRSYVGSSR